MSKKKNKKKEDKRVEYQSLRAELNQADKACLIMTGFLFTAFGTLFSINIVQVNAAWLVSALSFFAMLYYTEKRFSIRNLSFYIRNNIDTEKNGFGWESFIHTKRIKKNLRPIAFLRPYYFELSLCILGSLSPLMFNEFKLFDQYDCIVPQYIIWLIITLLVIAISIILGIKYEKLEC